MKYFKRTQARKNIENVTRTSPLIKAESLEFLMHKEAESLMDLGFDFTIISEDTIVILDPFNNNEKIFRTFIEVQA